MREPKRGRKIVSRGEYGWLLAEKSIATVTSLLLLLPSLFLFTAVVVCIIRSVFGAPFPEPVPFFFRYDWLLEPLLLLTAGLMFAISLKLGKHADSLDPGVPLTRVNTADLPAPESLVRASSEPVQAQEAMLLRAAGKGQERRAEELVRALVEKE